MNSINNSLNYSNENYLFHTSLPCIIKPFEGESLFGYLLRLDIANNFSLGSVLRSISLHSTGRGSLNRPGLFICGTIIDLYTLSELTNIDFNRLLDLTYIKLLRKVFDINQPYPELLGYSSAFKICPLCAKNYHFPLIHSIKNIEICSTHNVYLIDRCICGNKILLFNQHSKSLKCPICNIPYQILSTSEVEPGSDYLRRQAFLYDAYYSLMCEDIAFINTVETSEKGFENRLQHNALQLGIDNKQFGERFGYEA